METLLKIVGGLALGLVALLAVVALAAWLFVRGSIGRIRRLARAMGGPVAPVAVELAPLVGEAPASVGRLAAELERRGFARVGTFGVVGVPDYEIVALTNEHEAVYAAAAIHPMLGPHLDLFQRAADGRTLTATSSREMSPPPPIPGRTLVRRAGADVDTLLEAFAAARLDGALEPTPPDGFVPTFEAEYRRIMEAQYRDGALKGADLEGLSRLTGMRTDHATAAFLHDRDAAEAEREERLQAALLASGAVDAAEWETIRDDVLFIHDDVTDAEIAEIVAAFGTGGTTDDSSNSGRLRSGPAPEPPPAGASPRGRFRAAMRRAGVADRLRLVASLAEPEPFDVWTFMED